MDKPSVSCAVIIKSDYEYLLIQRAREPEKKKWSLISGIGGSKKGLSPHEAVQDEVRHDIGVDFIVERFCFDYPLPNVDYADQVHVFLGRVASEAFTLNPKTVLDAKWFTDQQLEHKDDLAFNDKWVLKMMGDFVNRLKLSQEGV